MGIVWRDYYDQIQIGVLEHICYPTVGLDPGEVFKGDLAARGIHVAYGHRLYPFLIVERAQVMTAHIESTTIAYYPTAKLFCFIHWTELPSLFC